MTTTTAPEEQFTANPRHKVSTTDFRDIAQQEADKLLIESVKGKLLEKQITDIVREVIKQEIMKINVSIRDLAEKLEIVAVNKAANALGELLNSKETT